MATRIFVCYRRLDSPYAARIVAEKVEIFFGRGSVFYDVRSIPLGVDFRTFIDGELALCEALLVIIGDKWLDIRDDDGRRLLEDPDDDVRIEIETALRRNLSIVPVLVDHATMPRQEELPPPLQPIISRNAAEVRSGSDLLMQIDRLIARLQQLQDIPRPYTDPKNPTYADQIDMAYPPTIDGIEWRYVPQGEFAYGESGERCTLDAFWIAKTPVTNAQYARFIRETGYEPPQYWKEPSLLKAKGEHPVAEINWYDAEMYCRWLSHRLGLQIDLPTQEEWEKAARGLDGRAYPWGDQPDEDNCNTAGSGTNDTTPVGFYSPHGDSPYGCTDMSGNVWEWTASEVHRDRPGFIGLRVTRGGSWNMDIYFARVTCRTEVLPYVHGSGFGFRFVRRLPRA